MKQLSWFPLVFYFFSLNTQQHFVFIVTGISEAIVQIQLVEDGVNDEDKFAEISIQTLMREYKWLKNNVERLVVYLDYTTAFLGNTHKPNIRFIKHRISMRFPVKPKSVFSLTDGKEVLNKTIFKDKALHFYLQSGRYIMVLVANKLTSVKHIIVE